MITKEEEDDCICACTELVRRADELIEVYRDALKGCEHCRMDRYMKQKLAIMETRQFLLQHIQDHKTGAFHNGEHKRPEARVN